MADEEEIFIDGRPVSDLRVVDLKKECDKRGLSKSGSKVQLMERLKAQMLLENVHNNPVIPEASSPTKTKQGESSGHSDFIRQYMEQQKQLLEMQTAQQENCEVETEETTVAESQVPVKQENKELKGEQVSEPTESVDKKPVESGEAGDDTSESPATMGSRRTSSKQSDELNAPENTQVTEGEPAPTKRASRLRKDDKTEELENGTAASDAPVERGRRTRRWGAKKVEDPKESTKDVEPETVKVEGPKAMTDDKKQESDTSVAPRLTEMERLGTEGSDVKDKTKTGQSDKDAAKMQDDEVNKEKKAEKRPATASDARPERESVVGVEKKEISEEGQGKKSEDGEKDDKQPSEPSKKTEEISPGEQENKEKPSRNRSASSSSSSRSRSRSRSSSKSRSRSGPRKPSSTDSQQKKVSSSADRKSRSRSSSPVRQKSRSSRNSPPRKTDSAGGKSESQTDHTHDRRKSRSRSGSPQSQPSSPVEKKSRSRSKSPAKRKSRSRSRSSSASSSSRSRSRSRDKSRSSSRSRSKTPEQKGKILGKAVLIREGDSFHTAPEDTPIKENGKEEKSSPMEVEEGEKTKEMDEKEEGEITPKTTPRSSRKISLTNREERISEDVDKENESGETKEKPARKRKWGSATAKSTKRTSSLTISTDSLKGLIPDIKANIMTEPVLDLGNEEEQGLSEPEEDKRDVKIRRTVVQVVKEKDRKDERKEEVEEDGQIDMVEDRKETSEEDKQTKEEPKVFRRLSKEVVVAEPDEPKAAPRSPSPARNPVSNIVHIRNLVRPFTLGQLKELLRRSGTLVDTGFWIDKIKSHCYAMFETEDMAATARKALHGTTWPQSNPKILRVDFASKDELNFHKEKDETPKDIKREIKQDVSIKKPKEKEKEKEKPKGKSPREERKKEVSKPVHVREWDRGKVPEGRARDRRSRTPSPSPGRTRRPVDRSRDRDRENRDRENRDRPKKSEKKVEEEAPAKLLDDLFRKTKATPCIYWLPLTEAGHLERLRQKKLRALEREKRRKEMEAEESSEKKPLEPVSVDRRGEPIRAPLKPPPIQRRSPIRDHSRDQRHDQSREHPSRDHPRDHQSREHQSREHQSHEHQSREQRQRRPEGGPSRRPDKTGSTRSRSRSKGDRRR